MPFWHVSASPGTVALAPHESQQRRTEPDAYGDLFKLSTFMIPRSELPELPEDVAQSMGFRYGDAAQ